MLYPRICAVFCSYCSCSFTGTFQRSSRVQHTSGIRRGSVRVADATIFETSSRSLNVIFHFACGVWTPLGLQCHYSAVYTKEAVRASHEHAHSQQSATTSPVVFCISSIIYFKSCAGMRGLLPVEPRPSHPKYLVSSFMSTRTNEGHRSFEHYSFVRKARIEILITLQAKSYGKSFKPIVL